MRSLWTSYDRCLKTNTNNVLRGRDVKCANSLPQCFNVEEETYHLKGTGLQSCACSQLSLPYRPIDIVLGFLVQCPVAALESSLLLFQVYFQVSNEPLRLSLLSSITVFWEYSNPDSSLRTMTQCLHIHDIYTSKMRIILGWL